MEQASFFDGWPDALAIHRAVARCVQKTGEHRVKVSKSQIGFYRKRLFAATWIPGRHLGGEVAPLVLSVFLGHRYRSSRWKEIVEPTPGRFTHHMELRTQDDVDDEVEEAIQEAWREAG